MVESIVRPGAAAVARRLLALTFEGGQAPVQSIVRRTRSHRSGRPCRRRLDEDGRFIEEPESGAYRHRIVVRTDNKSPLVVKIKVEREIWKRGWIPSGNDDPLEDQVLTELSARLRE